MTWFGRNWGAPLCEDAAHVATPAGETCARCGRAIEAADRGVVIPELQTEMNITFGVQGALLRPWHLYCFLRGIVGPDAAHFVFDDADTADGLTQ